MKRILKILGVMIGVAACVGIAVLLYYNVIAPLKIQGNYNVVIEAYDEISMDITKTLFEEAKDDEDWIRFYDELPSISQDDYTSVIIYANLKNRSFIRQDGIFANLKDIPKEERVLCQESRVRMGYMHKFEEDEIRLFYFTMYTKDMTREEIKEYIQNLKLDVYYGSDIRRDNHMTISLNNVNWEEE